MHSKADIGSGFLSLLLLARMIVQTDSSVQETGKLEVNFSYLRPYSRVIVLNMAATRKQWSMFKPRKQLCHRSERQKEKKMLLPR